MCSQNCVLLTTITACLLLTSLQTVLISIEERLRALDTLYSPRYAPRWEISMEQQSRRMETIESRLGRLETLLELRLDKLSETMSARQLKEELSKDQINRKLDSTYERLNHRLSYLEARLDISIAKLQSTIDISVGRMERLETTAAGRQSDTEAELADIGTGIDDIKKQVTAFEEQHNRSLVIVIENGKHMAVEMDNLTTLMEELHVEFNKTQAVSELNDHQGNDHQEALKKNMNLLVEKVTSSIDRNANNFITKANNMYNDMWRRTQLLEGLVKDSMSLSNATRRELQDGIRTIAVQMGRRGLFQSDRDRQEGSMDIALDTLGMVQRRLNELGRKFDSSFQMLMLAQNLFLESCHRIQLDEPQLETKLTKVLERILDAVTNRSMNTDHEVRTLQEVFKSQNSHLTQTLSHATNKMLQASKQSSEDSKLLQLSILGIKEQLLESNKYIEDAISDIRDSEETSTKRLFNIADSLQELQELITEMSTINAVARQDRDKYKDDTEDCTDNEQTAVAILTHMKRKGVTINHNVTNENVTAETNRGRDTETEVDKNYMFGAKEGFGEETVNETERNTVSKEVESTLLQILESPANTSEEENDEDEILMEGEKHGLSIADTNPTLNSSSFQRQHRFNLQTNKNSTTDKAESVKPAQVTIQIIPHNINLQLGNNDHHDQLLGLDLHNFAAIIQNSDSTVNQLRPPTLTIVHATASNHKNNTNVTQINTGDRDVGIDDNLQPNVNATSLEELNYINGTFAYNQSQNSDIAHNTEVQGSGVTVTSNNEEIKGSYSKAHSNVSQVPQTYAISLTKNQDKNENLPTGEIKENKSSDVDHQTKNTLHSNYNSSPNGQIFNTSERDHITTNGTISLANIINVTLKNVTKSNTNYTEVVSDIQLPAPLKRFMELNAHEGRDNLTLQNFWRDLLARNKLGQNGTSVFLSNFSAFTQNNSENQDIAQVKHKVSTLFSTNTTQNLESALNDTEDTNYGIQQQQYLNRLQELATELVNRKDGSALEIADHFQFVNTTDEIRRAISEERNK